MSVKHEIRSESGHPMRLAMEGRHIVDLRGDWPAGLEELVFADVPPHADPVDVPAHVVARADTLGMTVCYYDPNGCRTCYCDGNGRMRCVGMC